MRTTICLLCALATLVPRATVAQLDTAWVERSLAAPVAPGTALRADSQPGRLQLKSEGTAEALSIGTTLGLAGLGALELRGSANERSSLLLFTGLYLGPAVGYWYAGSPRWKTGFLIRSAAVGVGAAGLALWDSGDSFNSGRGDAGALMMIGGATVILVDAIVDCVNVRSAVREQNDAHASVQVLPMISPDGKHVGLGAHLTF